MPKVSLKDVPLDLTEMAFDEVDDVLTEDDLTEDVEVLTLFDVVIVCLTVFEEETLDDAELDFDICVEDELEKELDMVPLDVTTALDEPPPGWMIRVELVELVDWLPSGLMVISVLLVILLSF